MKTCKLAHRNLTNDLSVTVLAEQWPIGSFTFLVRLGSNPSRFDTRHDTKAQALAHFRRIVIRSWNRRESA